MGKTILIASIIAGIAIMLLVSSQLAFAPSNRVGFGFFGVDNGAGPSPPDIIMTGGGFWKVAANGITASGGFENTSTNVKGTWSAKSLTDVTTTCPPCTVTITGPGVVVFKAKFIPDTGAPFNADVVVALVPIKGTGENFWVQGFGFGFVPATVFMI